MKRILKREKLQVPVTQIQLPPIVPLRSVLRVQFLRCKMNFNYKGGKSPTTVCRGAIVHEFTQKRERIYQVCDIHSVPTVEIECGAGVPSRKGARR